MCRTPTTIALALVAFFAGPVKAGNQSAVVQKPSADPAATVDAQRQTGEAPSSSPSVFRETVSLDPPTDRPNRRKAQALRYSPQRPSSPTGRYSAQRQGPAPPTTRCGRSVLLHHPSSSRFAGPSLFAGLGERVGVRRPNRCRWTCDRE